MLCERCNILELKAMKALEGLTPGGSEFVNEVETCATFIRQRLDSTHRRLVETVKELNALKEAVKQFAPEVLQQPLAFGPVPDEDTLKRTVGYRGPRC